jgi:hypothetical protein
MSLRVAQGYGWLMELFTRARQIVAELDPVRRWDFLVYGLFVVGCFFLFQQQDLIITGVDSFKYLDGHITGFYDLRRSVYPPSTYVLFALWNLPLKLIGGLSHTSHFGFSVFWFKLLTSGFFFASAVVLFKIGRALGLSARDSTLMMILWVTAPLAFFSQFIFGQYDIFVTFFMLLGLLFYLRGRLVWFALILGVAITFKYFPVFLFFPLILLVEKRPQRLIGYVALFVLPWALEVLSYWHSPSFHHWVFGFNVNDRVFASVLSGVPLALFVLFWGLICGFAYFKDVSRQEEAQQWAVYLGLLVYTVLFSLVLWHPQWLLVITPFIAITTFAHARMGRFLMVDIVMMFVFVAFTVHKWVGNVDQSMLSYGVLGLLDVVEAPFHLLMRDLFVPHRPRLHFSLFTAGLVLHVAYKYPGLRQTWVLDKAGEWIGQNWNLVRSRFVLGVSFFVLPAFLCAFSSSGDLAYEVRVERNAPHVGELVGKRVGQVFRANCPMLSEVELQLATFRRMNQVDYDFVLREVGGPELFTSKLNAAWVEDNQFQAFDLGSTAVTPGKLYEISLSSSSARPGRAITVYRTRRNTSSENMYATLSGERQPFNLHFRLSCE